MFGTSEGKDTIMNTGLLWNPVLAESCFPLRQFIMLMGTHATTILKILLSFLFLNMLLKHGKRENKNGNGLVIMTGVSIVVLQKDHTKQKDVVNAVICSIDVHHNMQVRILPRPFSSKVVYGVGD